MTTTTTLPPDSPTIDQARFSLESALTDIFGLAHVLMALSEASDEVGADELSYLGGQLIDHERAASDAFNRIFKLSDYREQPLAEPGSQDGDAELTRAEGDAK